LAHRRPPALCDRKPILADEKNMGRGVSWLQIGISLDDIMPAHVIGDLGSQRHSQILDIRGSGADLRLLEMLDCHCFLFFRIHLRIRR
jgi:hypothetical protein